MADANDDLLSPKKYRDRQLNTLIALSNKFGDSLANAFANNVAEGKRLDDVLKGVRKSLLQMTLRTALAPLQLALSQSVQGFMTGALGGSVSPPPERRRSRNAKAGTAPSTPRSPSTPTTTRPP